MTPSQIRDIRCKAGMRQTDLARLLRMSGTGRRTVRRWENGETEITGPASLVVELLGTGELPQRLIDAALAEEAAPGET